MASRVGAAGTSAYAMMRQLRWQCAACRYQVSLTSGTILHNTRTPLTLWFWAAYLMTTDKRGISALLLQRQLGLRRYETAWNGAPQVPTSAIMGMGVGYWDLE